MKRILFLILLFSLFLSLFSSQRAFSCQAYIDTPGIVLDVQKDRIIARAHISCDYLAWKLNLHTKVERLIEEERVSELEERMADYFLRNFGISASGKELKGKILDSNFSEDLIRMHRITHVEIMARYDFPDSIESFRVRSQLFLEHFTGHRHEHPLDQDPHHHRHEDHIGLAKINIWGRDKTEIQLTDDNPWAEFSIERFRKTFIQNSFNSLLWGIKNILFGYGHLIFLIALVLSPSGFNKVTKSAAVFLASYILVTLFYPGSIIPISTNIIKLGIIITIIGVGLINNFWRDSRYYGILIAVFGAIHGLDFPPILNKIGLSPGNNFLWGIAFSIGILIAGMALIGSVYLARSLRLRYLIGWSESSGRERWKKELYALSWIISISGCVLLLISAVSLIKG